MVMHVYIVMFFATITNEYCNEYRQNVNILANFLENSVELPDSSLKVV